MEGLCCRVFHFPNGITKIAGKLDISNAWLNIKRLWVQVLVMLSTLFENKLYHLMLRRSVKRMAK